MAHYFYRAKSKVRKIFRATVRKASPDTSPIPDSSVPAQPVAAPAQQPSLSKPSPASTKSSLQEKIWNLAYDYSRAEEPKLVKAFEEVAFAEIHCSGTSAASTDQIEDNEPTNRRFTSHEMQKFIQNGIDQTKKEASLKQEFSSGLQAVNAVRGIIDGAIRVAPEAAAVWAIFCLGIGVLSNPITEALENHKGIQYVLCRMEWYWELASLLLDRNNGEAATATLRDKLEMDIIRLFQKLLLYQMRSICVYHRSQAATAFRDVFRIDDWAGQLLGIKEAEEAVQSHIEQYNSQESKMELQKLNSTADALQLSLQNIDAATAYQAECLRSIDKATQAQAEYLRNITAAAQDQKSQQASRREDDKDRQCLSDLYVTDPRTDKKEIEEKKGGLLKDSYRWILEHIEFRRFQSEKESRILWINGGPGKGKTMLLCGIINELEQESSVVLSYFFCQATSDGQLNKATSVLRGLIYDLARRNPQLITHVRKKYDYMGKKLFNNRTTWHDLCEIATSMLNDPTLQNAILIVDALDECSVERQRLLEFIAKPSLAKWIVSSRNLPDIEESLNDSKQKFKIHLEVNQASVSMAVESYITSRVCQLAQRKKYNDDMRTAVLEHLRVNAQGTFLWVALVCQELSNADTRKRHTLDRLKSFPPGLNSLYGRMLEQISKSQDAGLCMEILAKALVVYRTVTLEELHALVEPLEGFDNQDVGEIVRSCGSFLTLHNNRISFVHQSAKDYLLNKALGKILPLGVPHQHQMVLIRSLELLRNTLQRDIYRLKAPGCCIDQVLVPDPDPLAAIKYACIFWIDHLYDSPANVLVSEEDRVLDLFEERYLQWLEALSLLQSISAGIRAIEKLEGYLQTSQGLRNIVKDARRFLLSYGGIIEIAPLQVYASALIFSPTNSLIRQKFSREEPDWIEVKPRVEANWNACLQTLEGHNDIVRSVALSHDGQRLASGSSDKTVKIWDATSGSCLQTLAGHDEWVTSVAFSNDGQRLASGSNDKTARIWDATSGTCLQTLASHDSYVQSVAFSNDGQRLISGSIDKTVKIWDAASGTCLQTLEGHDESVTSVVFSSDGRRMASGSFDKTVKIWDATSGSCLQALAGHDEWVTSVAFSSDAKRLASGSFDKTVKIWDVVSGTCLQTLTGHDSFVESVVFSNYGYRLASGSIDKTVKIWDETSGTCLQTLEGHDSSVTSVVFSHDGQRLVSGSNDETVKIWDATSGSCLKNLEGHNDWVRSVALSHDGQRLASGSSDKTVKIWDATCGLCLQTLEGHDESVVLVAFSNDRMRLASASWDETVKIWDATSGACLQTLITHGSYVESVAFSNDGGRLASGSSDNTVKIWDATSGSCLQTFEGHNDWVTSVLFSDDGQRLVSGSNDKTIKIWDAASGTCLQTIKGHDERVTSMAFSIDGQQLASGSFDRTVKIWNATSGACLGTLRVARSIHCLSFDPLKSLFLSTEAGAFDITMPAPVPLASQHEAHLLQSNLHGYGISHDNTWIMKDGQRALWLPPGWRLMASSVAVSGTKFGIGCISGRVLVIGFKSAG